MSDGMDVGQVYQRAKGTGDTGWFYGSTDIGRLLLSRATVARARATGKGYTTYSTRTDTFTNTKMSFVIEGGSGDYSIQGWESEANAFATPENMSHAEHRWYRQGRYYYCRGVVWPISYSPVTHTIEASLAISGSNTYSTKDHSGTARPSDNRKSTWIRFRFVDNLTGVSYVSDPWYFINISINNGQWTSVTGCDNDCSCDAHCSDCSCDCDNCCEGSW